MRQIVRRPGIALLALALAATAAVGCSPNPRGTAGVSSPPPLPTSSPAWGRLDWTEAGRLTQFGREARITALAARDGLVVAGGTSGAGAPEGLVLLTEDGRGWERARDADLENVAIADIVATPDGFVAVGVESVGPGAIGVVLRSPDGRSWERLADLDGASLVRLTSGRNGFLALGEGREGRALFVSADARAWAPVSAPVLAGATVADIAAVDDGWVAVGSGAGRARAWASPDGRSWVEAPMAGADPVPGIAAVGVGSLVRSGTGLVALGTDDPPCEGDPERCPHFGAAWWSTDGSSWLRLPTDGPLGQWGQRVFAADEAGFVIFDGSAVLLSDDGYEWDEVPTNGPAPRYLLIDRAVMTGDLFVVAGSWIAEEPEALGVGAARVRR
ncbi:MAG: hypothetical protein MUC54_00580 [Chloroflexi bacterium]|nr:hypothetical protein [Chloroflexota bacterium]